MTKHIYIVRYGETQDNFDGVFFARGHAAD